jgi:hypothetical protein
MLDPDPYPDSMNPDPQSWYRHDETNEPTKEGPLSYVLQEPPFASVSTVRRGHPSMISLAQTVRTS